MPLVRPHPLDRLVALTLPRGRFFRDGWGDDSILAAAPEEDLLRAAAPVAIAWRPPWREGAVVVSEGTFVSPETRLPASARTAYVRRLAPATGHPRGVVVLLAASGDEGYGARTALARPLAADGLTTLVLENAYYGARRPPGQDGAAVRTVSDLILMSFATVKEARSLLATVRCEGVRHTCVAGYSMGGSMAALVAGAEPTEVAAVPMAPSASPAAVFTEGVLQAYPSLPALARAGESPHDTRGRLREVLGRFDATRLPAPRARHACVVVGTRRDAFVPPREMERLAAHWSCELRWLDAGHASAFLFQRGALRRAVLDAVGRLEPMIQ